MKKSFIKFANCLMLSSMFFVSCQCDKSVDIEYSLECSDDLLELVTTNVSYVSNNGIPVTIPIHDEDWKDKENNITSNRTSSTSIVIINGDTINKSGKIKQWIKQVHYDDFPIMDEMTVTYSIKEGVPSDAMIEIANFLHNLQIPQMIIKDEKKGKETVYQGISLDINTSVGKVKLKDYVEGLKEHKKVVVNSADDYTVE